VSGSGMPIFSAPDGTALSCRLLGSGGEPVVCLPGGPMRAGAYLGDLGGLGARLAVLDLRGTGESGVPADPGTYRCDRQVEDVEALRKHLGLDRLDLLIAPVGAGIGGHAGVPGPPQVEHGEPSAEPAEVPEVGPGAHGPTGQADHGLAAGPEKAEGERGPVRRGEDRHPRP
jgi:hypothetical protein